VIQQAIEKTYSDEKFWEILVNKSSAKSGPFDGGCLICAKAMQLAIDDADLVRITSTLNGGQTEHYGIRHEGVIFDMDGRANNEHEWIEHFQKNEGVFDRELNFSTGYDSATDTPDDAWAVKEISKLFSKNLNI